MRWAWMTVALLAVGGCTVKGSGKASTPAWKMYKDEHPQNVRQVSIRDGSIELKVAGALLEEHKTVLAVSHWTARVRLTIVGSESVPLESLSGAFTIIGRSGKVYRPSVLPIGQRTTWQRQEHTGQPTHLPAGVSGEIDLFTQVGDDKSHDELAAFTFRSLRVPLAP
jgi:hypothetical protein